MNPSAFRAPTSKRVHSSSSFDSIDSGMESLPRDIRDRLMFSDAGSVSGRSSSCASSCTSPAPSETCSETPTEGSRVSTTMEFDIGNKGNIQKSEVTFNVGAPNKDKPNNSTYGQHGSDYYSSSNNAPSGSGPVANNTQNARYPSSVIQATPTIGSGASTSVNVSEENGKRILTKES